MNVYIVSNNLEIVKVFSSFKKTMDYIKTTYPTGYFEEFNQENITWRTDTRDENGDEIFLDIQRHRAE